LSKRCPVYTFLEFDFFQKNKKQKKQYLPDFIFVFSPNFSLANNLAFGQIATPQISKSETPAFSQNLLLW
jgi:hypothetical protein